MKDKFELVMQMVINTTPAPIPDIIEAATDYYAKERDSRIKEFHISLLNGTATKDRVKYEKEYIKKTSDSYYSLLSASIEDEEMEKSQIYANLYNSILRGKIKNKKEKLRYLKFAKRLPYSVFELLPMVFVYDKFDIKDQSSQFKKDEIANFYKHLVNEYSYELELLEKESLIQGIKRESKGIRVKNFNETTNDYRVTMSFYKIIDLFFNSKELTPALYNLEHWIDKVIVYYPRKQNKVEEFDEPELDNTLYINKLLRKNNYRISKVLNIHDIDLSSLGNISRNKTILIIDKTVKTKQLFKLLKKCINPKGFLFITFYKFLSNDEKKYFPIEYINKNKQATLNSFLEKVKYIQ